MSTAVTPQPVTSIVPTPAAREVRVYSHSPIFYWWPVWFVGYLLALLTYIQGQPTAFVEKNKEFLEGTTVLIHPNQSLGVVFTFTFLLVIMMTHFAVRGIASLTVIIAGIALVLFFAYMGWWGEILRTLGELAIFMNLGFYLFFATALFIIWALAVFVFVRFNYYVFRPGQMAHIMVWGGGEESFDTRGMVVVKMRDDLFRHWVLGLGSGDMHVATTGARSVEMVIPNVLFVGYKLERIQQLIAMKPDDTPDASFTAGQPA